MISDLSSVVDVPYDLDMSSHLLLVEDDDQIAAPLIRTLEREEYEVERVADGLTGVERVAAGGIDLVLLDLGLPDIDGLEVCRRLRAAHFEGGIMILTARGGELDRVVGLDVGADDYLGKPFSLAELLARVRALLRRSVPDSTTDIASDTTPTDAPDDVVRLDVQARRIWVGPTEITLTAKEFDVIALLASEPGAVVTRERVMDDRLGRELVRLHQDARRHARSTASEARGQWSPFTGRHGPRRRLPPRDRPSPWVSVSPRRSCSSPSCPC